MSAFRFSLQHNDTYAFREYPLLTANQRIHQEILPDMSGKARVGVHRCEACGELIAKWDDPLTGVIVKNRKYDIGSTYDGVIIVSERFKTVCESSNLSGIDFHQLPDDPAFFAIRALRSVEFDSERRKTRFINPCPKCGRYESVVGVTPVYLKAGSEIGLREFVRTDLEFGSNDEKGPLLLCGASAADALKKSGLKGVDLTARED